MVFDLYHLADYASGGREPQVPKFVAATTVPLVVFFGALYRFYANEFRTAPGGSLNCAQITFGVVGFGTSCVLLAIVMYGILEPLTHDEITDPKRKSDRDAVWILTLVWIGYPILSIVSRLLQARYSPDGTKFNPWISTLKDIVYAALDVTAKGGLALYVCMRSTWL